MHHVHTCEHRYTNSPGALGVPRLPGASDPTDKFSEILNHCANKTDFWFSQETFREGNAQLPNCPIVLVLPETEQLVEVDSTGLQTLLDGFP